MMKKPKKKSVLPTKSETIDNVKTIQDKEKIRQRKGSKEKY